MLIWEPCLVGEGVDDVDPDLTASTVGPGVCDWVPDTTVHQPAWTALVKPLIPCRIHLASSGQCSIEFLTVLHSLLIGEAIIVTGEENLTWKNHIHKRSEMF